MRPGQEVKDEVLVSLYVFYQEVILGKPIFQSQQLLIMKCSIFKFKDLRERRVVKTDVKMMTNQVELKIFNSILDSQDLFIYHIVVVLGVLELPTSMGTKKLFAIYQFEQNSTPVFVACINLENSLTSGWNL